MTFLGTVVSAADAELAGLVQHPAAGSAHRTLMREALLAVACEATPSSRWFGDARALTRAAGRVAALAALQGDHGLFSGDNVDSPPDSGFTLNDLAQAHEVLVGRDGPAARLATDLAAIAVRAAPAMLAGGLHTPNHRWELAAALARMSRLLDDPALAEGARTWLQEGVDVDEDGLYSERSVNYAAFVSNPCLLALGDLLGRDDLVEVVHRNLHALHDLTDRDGGVETVFSRRQDQRVPMSSRVLVMQYRRFAAQGCLTCTAAASAAAAGGLLPADLADVLTQVLAHPALGAELPAVAPPVPTPERWFGAVRLLRRQRGERRLIVYGGSDVPEHGRIASGLACNPTFLRYRHGDAVLESVRISRGFFGLGPFRASDMTALPGGARLRQDVTASYYHPLPEAGRRPDGRYPFEHEGRFAAAMAFSQRRRTDLVHRTTVDVVASDDGVDVTVTTDGPACPVTVELAFRDGGRLTGGVGVVGYPGADVRALAGGRVVLEQAGARLEITRSGVAVPTPGVPVYEPGEAYTFLGGTDAVGGPRVYVAVEPGTTERLTIRSA